MSEKEYPTEEYPTEDNQAPEQQQQNDAAKEETVSAHEPEDDSRAADAEAHEPVGDSSSEDVKKGGEAAPREEKPKRAYKLSPGVLIFGACVFIAFVFCIAGMPIGMFNSREDGSCISIWGYKPRCLGTWFRHIDFDDWRGSGRPCNKADSLVQGAQAFSVMSIIGGFLTVGVAILEILGCAEFAVVAGIMSCITTVATLVTWSTMCAMYWANLCGLGVYADTHRMGAGLILFITAWCLQMVGNIALIVDIYLGNVK